MSEHTDMLFRLHAAWWAEVLKQPAVKAGGMDSSHRCFWCFFFFSNIIKRRSIGPDAMTAVPQRQGKFGHRDKGYNALWRQSQRLGRYTYNQRIPRISSQHQKLEERRGADSSSEPMREPTPPMPWFQISSLQNCERIHFYDFKPFSLWYVTAAVLRNKCNTNCLKKEDPNLPCRSTPDNLCSCVTLKVEYNRCPPPAH